MSANDLTGTIIGANPSGTYTVRLDLASAPVIYEVPNISGLGLKVPDRVYLRPAVGRGWNYQILAPMGSRGGGAEGVGSTIRVVSAVTGRRVRGALVIVRSVADSAVLLLRRLTNERGDASLVVRDPGEHDIQASLGGTFAFARVLLPQRLVILELDPNTCPHPCGNPRMIRSVLETRINFGIGTRVGDPNG